MSRLSGSVDSVSVWNGASFYFKVMGNSKEVAALRKELEDLQKEVEGRKTPASVASVPSGDAPGDISIGDSAVASPMLGASGSGPAGASPHLAEKDGLHDQVDAATDKLVALDEEKGKKSATSPLSADSSIPDLRLDDQETGDAESDGSGVLVPAPKSL